MTSIRNSQYLIDSLICSWQNMIEHSNLMFSEWKYEIVWFWSTSNMIKIYLHLYFYVYHKFNFKTKKSTVWGIQKDKNVILLKRLSGQWFVLSFGKIFIGIPFRFWQINLQSFQKSKINRHNSLDKTTISLFANIYRPVLTIYL